MLPARMILFFLFQALFAAGFWLAGASGAWNQAAAWWPFSVGFTGLVCLFLLNRLYRQEGCRYWDIYRFNRQHVKGDLLALLGVLVITGPVAMLPNPLLGTALYGDSLIPARLLFAPLPTWAVIAGMFFFPIMQGLTELPTYFNYGMPRLGMQTRRPWLGFALASIFLGLQHVMAPLRFEWQFIGWRGLMFIPFAFLMGAALKWRPRLLPYLAIGHVLIDVSAMAVYFMPM